MNTYNVVLHFISIVLVLTYGYSFSFTMRTQLPSKKDLVLAAIGIAYLITFYSHHFLTR